MIGSVALFLDFDSYKKNINSLQSLYLKSFNRKISSEYLVWRYLDNPVKELYVNVLFDDCNNIVANYSVSPFMLKIGGRIEKAAISMTTMVDPLFRGKGLTESLAQELYEKMEQDGYKAIMMFPNRNSFNIFKNKLNMKFIYEIPTMKLDLWTQEESVFFEEIVKDSCFKYNYDIVVQNELNCVEKSKEYFLWRYKQNPLYVYENYVIQKEGVVSSFCIVKLYNEVELDIVDFNASNIIEANMLLKHIISEAKKNNLKFINCWASAHSFVHDLFIKSGFIPSAPITYFGMKFLDKYLENDFNSNFASWSIQMGDSDVY